MSKIIAWITTHKLVVLLLLIIVFFLFKDKQMEPSLDKTMMRQEIGSVNMKYAPPMAESQVGDSSLQQVPPVPGTDRMVIQDSNLSLQVSDVSKTQKQITQKAQEVGGFMVTSNVQNPSEVSTATVTVRVPSNKLEEVIEYYKSLSVKVVSENLNGQDVTDQYTDIEARLATLNKTKVRFEEIMDKATEIQDILTAQREIINIQFQIDALKGQQEYLSKSAQLSLISVYLSTDEFSLPYEPVDSWRPEVILKEAVRSLIGLLRAVGTLAIWTGVYAVIIVPVMLVVYFVTKKKSKNRVN